MSTVRTVTVSPEAGDVVEIPEMVGRVNIDRVGSPEIGLGRLKIGIAGQGDMIEHVLLKSQADWAEVEDGSQVLGVDVAKGHLWYAVPASAYGGEA